MHKSIIYAIGLLATAHNVFAQTHTDCQPLNQTCPPDAALGISNYTVDFTSTPDSRIWNTTEGTLTSGLDGTVFTIKNPGDAPTIRTNFYIMFGVTEVIMRASPGTGIISSIVLLSDDLDEIDWEFMGGNTTYVTSNFFGKGNTTLYDRGGAHPVQNPQTQYHNYTTHWTQDQTDWIIDGNVVRTLKFADYHNGTQYPQTPMRLSLGSWAGGGPGEAESIVSWAGGKTDFSKGPFNMNVKSVRVSDQSTGTTYTYSDNTGDWQSIKSAPGNSTFAQMIQSGPQQTILQKIEGLSTGVKIAIASSIGGTIVLLGLLITCCCIKNRRAGRREREIADAEYNRGNAELQAWKQENVQRIRMQREAVRPMAPTDFAPAYRPNERTFREFKPQGNNRF